MRTLPSSLSAFSPRWQGIGTFGPYRDPKSRYLRWSLRACRQGFGFQGCPSAHTLSPRRDAPPR